MPLFSKVLVANRGEIAIRVFRTLRELGVAGVAVYSDADAASLHLEYADEAWGIGGAAPAESYLMGERIIDVARRPARRRSIPATGSSRRTPASLGRSARRGSSGSGRCPRRSRRWAPRSPRAGGCVPRASRSFRGRPSRSPRPDDLVRLGSELGWPLAIKASAGGGGKGLKVVAGPDEAARAFEAAKREGEAYFLDATVYVERYLDDPRHVEVCRSSPMRTATWSTSASAIARFSAATRSWSRKRPRPPTPSSASGSAGSRSTPRAVGYRSAGTIEGLLSQEGEYFFLEMNTRIQVEHTVTEMATGVDLVREQVLIAAGSRYHAQEDVRLSGHAIECRINAEDAATGFLPSPGRITSYWSRRARRARRLGRAGGLRDPWALRPDGRQVDRARAGSRAGSRAHAAGAA